MKPVIASEVLTDLDFPANGIDVAGEFERQRQGTTPEGVNVRALDPGSMRQRGGQRAGLVRYVDEQVGDVSSLIQHLNVIVDPTVDALIPDYAGEDGVFDPSNSFLVRPGGSGIAPNLNKQITVRVVVLTNPTAVIGHEINLSGEVAVDVQGIIGTDSWTGPSLGTNAPTDGSTSANIYTVTPSGLTPTGPGGVGPPAHQYNVVYVGGTYTVVAARFQVRFGINSDPGNSGGTLQSTLSLSGPNDSQSTTWSFALNGTSYSATATAATDGTNELTLTVTTTIPSTTTDSATHQDMGDPLVGAALNTNQLRDAGHPAGDFIQIRIVEVF